jgi:hypothetical protein
VARRNKNTKTNSRFWLVSAVLHGLVLTILFLTPAGQKVFKPKERALKPEVVREDEELAEVIDDIRELAVDRLKVQVELLQAGRERMATNFDTMNTYYRPFVAGQVETARERLVAQSEKTFALQQEVLDAVRNGVEKKEAGSDAMWRTYDGRRAAIVAGQEEIRRALMLTASDDQALVDLQNQSEQNQMQAFERISESVGAQNGLWGGASKLEKIEETLKDMQPKVDEAEKIQTELTPQIAKLEAAYKDSVQGVKDADKALKDAKNTVKRAEKDKQGVEEARGALKLADAALNQARKVSNEAKDTWNASKKELAAATKTVKWGQPRLEKQLAEKQSITESLPEKTIRRDTMAAEALKLQTSAISEQKEVYDRLLVRLDQKAQESEKQDQVAPAPASATEETK